MKGENGPYLCAVESFNQLMQISTHKSLVSSKNFPKSIYFWFCCPYFQSSDFPVGLSLFLSLSVCVGGFVERNRSGSGLFNVASLTVYRASKISHSFQAEAKVTLLLSTCEPDELLIQINCYSVNHNVRCPKS